MTSLISPSKITAWLACEHTLTLHRRVEARKLKIQQGGLGDMAEMLMEKGQSHELDVLARYAAEGKSVFHVPERITPENPAPADAQGRTSDDYPGGWEPFAAWVERVGNPMADGHDVIYQLPMLHDGARGVADFLIRIDATVDDPEHYEAVDAKLARIEAKPGHVLQLCFYADALEALTGHRGEHIHLELGSGEVETIRLDHVDPYWRRLRRALRRALDEPAETAAEQCSHCDFCEFHQVCDDEWRDADSLVYIAGVRRPERAALVADGVETMRGLAALDRSLDVFEQDRLDRLVEQARLQLETKEQRAKQPEGAKPTFALIDTPQPVSINDGDAELGVPAGFAALPEPNEGDVFLDFEGHPFWTPKSGLFFLLGLIERPDPSASDEWAFTGFSAHDLGEQATATKDLIEHLVERRERFPGMHVYHYNHTERSSLERMTHDHGVAELDLEQLIAAGVFVDILPIVTGAILLGEESYGLKHVELLTDFERSQDIGKGAAAVVEYERWMSNPDPAERDQSILDRIARYNEDDVVATLAVRDWLVEHRPDDLPWRAATLLPEEQDAEIDERIAALHATGPGTPEHLMGDLLGYWRREKKAVAAEAYRLSIADQVDQLDSRSAITGLTYLGNEDRFSSKTGKPLKWPATAYSYPEQMIDNDIDEGSKMIIALSEQEWVFFEVASIDREAREIRLVWNGEAQEAGVIPTSLSHYVWFHEGAKFDALIALADQLRDGNATSAAHALLRRDIPRFEPGKGPTDGLFEAGVDEVCEWVDHIQASVVPIQGPPGTGKTFTGAHIIRQLVLAGRTVGITAMSHHAIDNLTKAVVGRFTEDGDIEALRAVRKAKKGSVKGVEYIDNNGKCADGGFNVIAGTPWLFASQAMIDNPVDVLIVDEAGQLGLADTMAASISAGSVILLGDPQQLPQVAQASHPNGSGASALEHLLGSDVTVRPDRGVFLDTTWRMHPDVSGFISDVMYDGRLGVHPTCATQTVDTAGTGLRWLRAEHSTSSTSSQVEAEMIAAQIGTLIGTPWTDQQGKVAPLGATDFMVVAPYNDQVRLIREVLSGDERLAGVGMTVEVGTVDKFQGREAAVVFYSMTTSSSEHMPRNADFLFSKNRLNVAVSRARCLAYLVCTDELLSTRAKSVEEMKLIGALHSFVERAER